MNEPTGNGAGGRITAAGSWILRNFLRLLTAIVLGASIGAGLFYAGRSLLGIEPAVSETPVEPAAPDMDAFLARLETLEEEQVELEQRIDSLERENAAQQDALLSLLDREAQQEETEAAPAPAETPTSDEPADSSSELESLAQRLDAVELALSSMPDDGASSDEQTLFRAMLHMLRAKISLMDDNYGQAQEDLALARAAIERLGAVTDVDIILNRMDRVLEELTSSPQIAEEDVSIIWNLLVDLADTIESGDTDS